MPGTEVTLKALPNIGYAFAGWLGNVQDPNSAATVIKMDAEENATANFMPAPE
jgi:hypothetical protein